MLIINILNNNYAALVNSNRALTLLTEVYKMKNVVIIGASHAAVEAISTLRKSGWDDKISLIGDETDLPYQRPPLSKGYFKGELEKQKLAIKPADFYQKNNVDLYLGLRAEKIDRDSKTVILSDKRLVQYSDLILATGTSARHLPVVGADLPCIKYLRTLQDVDQIRNSLNDNDRLLIVGAGYIGLELAASAAKQNIKTTVLESMDRVLARVTSPVISEFYQTVHAQEGVDIRLNANLVKVDRVNGHYIAILSSGELLEFECAVIGIGVSPNIELAKAAGLSCDNGIVVDELTRTDDPSIYAVGDCCNHPSLIYDRRIRLESVPNAVGQAKTAANAICGKEKAYDLLPWFWSDQYDVKLQTAGLLTDYDDFQVNGDINNRKFSVSYFKDGKLIALDAINSPADFMKAKKQIISEHRIE